MKMLREFRENMKLTQDEFAKSVGVSTSLYVKIELRRQKAESRVYSKIKKQISRI